MARIHISALTSIILASAVMVSQVNAEENFESPVNITPQPTKEYAGVNYSDTWLTAGSSDEFLIMNTGNSQTAFLVSSSGNTNLANTVFIDRTQVEMGIGTVTPEDTLHVKGNGNLILEQESGAAKWKITTRADGGIGLRDMPSGNDPFSIDANAPTDSLNIADNGNIGIGIDTPSTTLDVNGPIQSSLNGPGTESVYKLLTLSANDTDGDGPSEAAFVLRNEIAGQEWLFRTIDHGKAFTATLAGTGGAEFKIVSDEDDYTKTKLYIGGKLVFANGKIQSNVLP